VADDLIGYDALTQEAMRFVVRTALQRAASPDGLPGRHHFYVTFRTHAPGVVLPEHLQSRYPEEITIVLEHQFWGLEVFSDRFRVILKFGGHPYPIVAPFTAITRFYDPCVRFGLQFDTIANNGRVMAPMEHLEPPAAAVTSDLAVPDVAYASGDVVSLDAFRKK
jgi:hypothetical protein